MAKKAGLFDLETHFAFYGAHHSNPINILIHILFLWPIYFTGFMLLYFTPSIFDISQIMFTDNGLLLVNFGFFFASIHAFFFVCLDKKAGTLAALLFFACWVGASFISSRLGFSLAWKVVLIAQLICWTGQFIGHGVFEKRAPAFLENLVQASLMAPFFVFLEVLQITFGYEPYPGFHARVKANIDRDIKEWEEKKST